MYEVIDFANAFKLINSKDVSFSKETSSQATKGFGYNQAINGVHSMASDMMTGKGGRRSGVDRRSEFITPYVSFTYKGSERRSGDERRSGFDRRQEMRSND